MKNTTGQEILSLQKEGKKVLGIMEYGTSKQTVGIVGGIPIMKVEKLLPLC